MRTLISILALLVLPATACELLVKARSVAHPDATEDRIGRAKRGMIVEVRPDGANYGTREGLPRFVVIKIPGISVAKAMKYMEVQLQDGARYRYRLWQIRWGDLPLAARNKLRDNGELIIKATDAYTGTYDYTWTQVKEFFRNLETNQDETADL